MSFTTSQGNGYFCNPLMLFSDSCGDETKCFQFIPSSTHHCRIFFLKLLTRNLWFPVIPFHNDWDFGNIKGARQRAQHLYVPQDWCDLVHTARRNNAGQNRNVFSLSLILHIVAEFSFEVIDQKFMVSGHSFLHNDWAWLFQCNCTCCT